MGKKVAVATSPGSSSHPVDKKLSIKPSKNWGGRATLDGDTAHTDGDDSNSVSKGGAENRKKFAEMQSIHGDTVRGGMHPWNTRVRQRVTTPSRATLQAARRRAITELLFFASVGDLRRCQRIVRIWNLNVRPVRRAAAGQLVAKVLLHAGAT